MLLISLQTKTEVKPMDWCVINGFYLLFFFFAKYCIMIINDEFCKTQKWNFLAVNQSFNSLQNNNYQRRLCFENLMTHVSLYQECCQIKLTKIKFAANCGNLLFCFVHNFEINFTLGTQSKKHRKFANFAFLSKWF